MAVPTFVQAGTGVATTTGSATASLAGCIAGNVVIYHIAERGVAEDFTSSGNPVNIENTAGGSGTSAIVTGSGVSPGVLHQVHIGRVVSNGTVSLDHTVGASGNDLYARLYEFSGVNWGNPGPGLVFENGSNPQGRDVAGGTSATPNFAGTTLITNSVDRLGITVMALASNQAVSDWTSETGGDFTETTAEFASATGSTCTLQLQTASLASATTVQNGTMTVGASTDWVICFFALIPTGTSAPLRVVRSPLRW